MFTQFSEKAQKIIVLAESIAFDLCHNIVGSEHLLLALLRNKENIFTQILSKYDINEEVIYKDILRLFKKGEDHPFYMEYSDQVKDIIAEAIRIAADKKVTIEMFSLALLNQSQSVAYELLCKYHVDIEFLKESLSEDSLYIDQLNKIKELKNLNDFTNHYLIGREKELNQLMQILCKKEKSNALLIGKAGVGKTALVEHLAGLINEGNVFKQLKNKIIYELSLADVVAGTKYRGEFEEKFKCIINKCMKSKQVILFIDEIHNLIGAGGAEGAIDASNILKPYIARNDITLIGATTHEEYQRFLLKDQAINRRFSIVKIKENTEEEAFEILKGIKQKYETYHDVTINDDILHIIIEMTKKYMPSRVFPDKAIDVLDLTCVKTKFNHEKQLNKNYVKEVIEELLGISLNEFIDIDDIEKKMNEHIIGHKESIHQLLLSLKQVNNLPYQKTKGNYLLLGNPSIGKKETCHYLSSILNRHFIQLDMCDYQDYSSLYRIIGKNSFLLKEIHLYPHSLLLLENIDQAHASIIHLLTKIFEEGKIRNEDHQVILFHDVIICMTSSIDYNQSIGYKESLKLNDYFSESFMEQVNEVILFKLEKDDMRKIIYKYTNKDIDHILQDYDQSLGIRKLLYNIRKNISTGID